MLSRLLLGTGALSTTAVARLAERSGTVRVLDSDRDRVVRIREAGVAAERADVTDSVVLAGWRPVDIVLVGGRVAATNVAAARAAAEAFPEAYLVALAVPDAGSADRTALRDVADRVVDPGATLLESVGTATGGGPLDRFRRLRQTLAAVDGTLGVVTHDNPDPDAIASAIALVRIAAAVDCEAEAAYFGEISHQENRAMVNLLDLHLERYEAASALPYDAYALVDHAQPGVNDQLPTDADVRIVFDHHPKTEPLTGVPFVDRRTDVGATSTLLADYVTAFPVDLEGTVATALLYGIRVDTDDFRREVSHADFEAAASLLDHADRDRLARIEEPSIAGDTLDTIARAIHAREIRDHVLVACIGSIGDRDALSQAADRLLGLEGVAVTVICGFTEGTVYVSARARGIDVDLGVALREAVGDLGSAGGHADMAGAQLPLGVFDDEEADPGMMARLVDRVVTERVFGTLGVA